MEFQSERAVINLVSETIIKSGVSLYNAVKYIYALAEDDFYNCKIKDVLKVVLNNLTDTNCLQALGLRINNQKCEEMNTPEYNKVLAIIVYSFAVRIPILKKIKYNEQTLSDDQLRQIFLAVIAKGAENHYDAIPEKYDDYKKYAKTSSPQPPYTADWYKAYIFTYVPTLTAITNKNMFLLGVVDILFTMFYACLEEELENMILKFAKA